MDVSVEETSARKLQAENDAFYRRVKASGQALDPTPLTLNRFWGGENMALLERIVGSGQSPVEKVRAVLATDLFSHGAHEPEIAKRQIEWWLEYLRQAHSVSWDRIPDQLQESALTLPGSQIVHQGHRLSPDFLRHYTLALEVQRHCQFGDGPVNVLELGAGYGGFARIFKLLRPSASYVVVDIPETLYFSSLFLRLNFPDARFHYVAELPETPLDVSQYDFVFVPIAFAEAVLANRFELFYNTCSLGEMKNIVIRYWMEFVQERMAVRYFFGLNRYLNTIDPEMHAYRLDENQASVSFDAHWRILHWELEPSFTRCPYHETFASRNLQVVAERLPEASRPAEANREESERLVAQLRKQDWWIYAWTDNAMRLRDNFLGPDLGRAGTLFQLWEAIRLSPSVEKVSMMLTYLYQLRRERPFEEVFFYLDQLEALRRQNGSPPPAFPPAWSSDLLNRDLLTQPWGVRHSPKLVEGGYRGYNLVHYRAHIFALDQSLEYTDLRHLTEQAKADLRSRRWCFVGKSVEEVKRAVDESGLRKGRGFNLVELVRRLGKTKVSAPAQVSGDEARSNYRMLEQGGLWYAVPKDWKGFNLAQPAQRNRPEVYSARNQTALDQLLGRPCLAWGSPTAKLLVRDYRGLQLFALEGLFLAVQSPGGGLDFERLRSRLYKPLFAAETLSGLKRTIDRVQDGTAQRPGRALVIGSGDPEQTRRVIAQVGCREAVVLVRSAQETVSEWPNIVAPALSLEVLDQARAAEPEIVAVPYPPRLGETPWEKLVAPFCPRLLALFPDGSTQMYEGDPFNRLLYNMAYLRSMYRQVPPLEGQHVLEIGCSDGLTCDLVAREGARCVEGVDKLETVGLLYPNARCRFHRLDATTLPFADASFDLVYSIATFEHVADPLTTLKTMKRLLRRGGYGYVQAAPLYYSPFGHHMFGYFDDYPWIHVRLSRTEIAEYARASGIAAKIEAARGEPAEDYINGMINLRHINGKLLHEYGIEKFGSLAGVEIVNFTRSQEGQGLLTPQILLETKPRRREDLLTHGFELVFRVK
jgi:putative sugar O-methyltransferase